MGIKSKVLVVTIDGVRSDALAAARTPVLDALRDESSYGMEGRTIFPCCTLPAHTSLFYGIEATRHGVMTNKMYPKIERFRTFFDTAFDAGYRTGAYVSWLPLLNIYGNREKLTACRYHKFYTRIQFKPIGPFFTNYEKHLSGFIPFLVEEGIDVGHLYLEAPDVWGHYKGWMSKDYLYALEVSDSLLGKILEQVHSLNDFKECTILITTDHGGTDYGHEEDTLENRRIWFMLKGKGVKKGSMLTDFHITDFVPTLARCLDLEINPDWQGKNLDVFTETFSYT